jgi:hypothetical protein
MVCVEYAIGSGIVWLHPMELLSDVGQVEGRFSPLGDNVNLSVR